jgi:hypothetical protein
VAGAKPAGEVVGAVETQRALRRMADDLGDPATAERAGAVVLARADELVPRVSGALAGTLRLVLTDAGVDVLAGSPLVPYAGVIQYGWSERGIRAQPYLTDSLEQRAEAIHDVYADRVADLVERVGRES